MVFDRRRIVDELAELAVELTNRYRSTVYLSRTAGEVLQVSSTGYRTEAIAE